MNKKFVWGKLKIELLFCLLFSFAVSAGLFFLLQSVGAGILDNYFYESSFIEEQTSQAVTQFKNYVADHNLLIHDREQMAKWIRNEKYVNINIYQEGNLLYAFNGNRSAFSNEDYLTGPIIMDEPLYDIEFADANAKMYIECFFEYKYYYIVTFLGVAVSFICFLFIVLLFLNHKTSYIGMLENEIKILEGGNLDYQITLHGNDELSSLAQSINEMRKSFIERLENEDMARQANRELVTAMSHDLRTPLTVLVGYLDIIEYKKYRSDEDLLQYIHNSREKAYQIKHLSDKLFEYFTVFNANEEDFELESFDGIQLIDQLVDEQLLLLQNNGFQFELDACDTPFHIKVNLPSIRRVFDNIFSNITKYSDPSKPVKINYYVENHLFFIDIENSINYHLKAANGTGIGMKTCEKIIEKHEGKIAVTKTRTIYSVHISLVI